MLLLLGLGTEDGPSVHTKLCSTLTTVAFLQTNLRRLGSFETKSLDLRNIFCRSYLVNTRQIEVIFR